MIKTGKNQKTNRCRAGHRKRRRCFKIRAKWLKRTAQDLTYGKMKKQLAEN
jgi:hypothetical protein